MTVVVDPNGSSSANSLCMDSRIARADTFLARDVPAWINRTLDVDPDPRHWAVGGFSFGATCAMQMVTRHPDVYGAALAFSSEREPSLAKERRKTIQASFGGDAAAFDRLTPLSLMAENRFDGHGVYFAAGDLDPKFTGYMDVLSAAARQAGFTVENTPDRQCRTLVGHRGRRPARWPGLPGPALGDPGVSQTTTTPTRTSPPEPAGPSWLGVWQLGSRRALAHFRAVPFTLAVLAAFLLIGALTGSFLSGPPHALLPIASVSAPGLRAGQWWSLFTSLFFATNPLAYLAASLMILLLLGLAERHLGSLRTAVFFFAAQFAAVTLFLLITQVARYLGDGWLGLMVNARLIGPYAAVLAVALAASGLLPTLWQRRLRTAGVVSRPAAGALPGASGDGGGAGRRPGRPGGGLVDPGRPGDPAPAPFHWPRDAQPAGPHGRHLCGGADPHGRCQQHPPGLLPCCATSCSIRCPR